MSMQFMKSYAVSNMARNLGTPAIISLGLVLPFMILEWINRRNLPEGFPVALFGLMWLLPLLFILILMSIVRSLPAGDRNPVNPLTLLSKVILLAFIALIWVRLIIDQMPCFLGVPNCD